MWVSAPLAEDPEPWVEVRWADAVRAREIDVILDASIEVDLINLHHHYTRWRTMPGMLRSYDLAVETEDGWSVVEEVRNNHIRMRRHALGDPTGITAVRVTARESEADQARVVNIRVR